MKTRFLHQHPRKILLLAAVGVMAALFFLWPRGPREPVYQGKTLTQWIQEAMNGAPEDVTPANDAAMIAFGTNAVPFLLKEFTRPLSHWRGRLTFYVNQLPWFKIHLRTPEERLHIAAQGLMSLGRHAAPAIPVVIRCLDDPVRGGYAKTILQNCGETVVPYLCAEAASADVVLVCAAIRGLGIAGGESGLARQTIGQSLHHHDPSVRAAGVKAWSWIRRKDESVVADLLKWVDDPSPLVPQQVTNQLQWLCVLGIGSVRVAASNALLTLRTNAPPPRAHGP